MSVDALLSRVDAVKQTGADTWLARCPAHDDKHPSLSIRQVDRDRTLLHCFGGCSAHEVLAAVGLQFDALFPKGALDHHRPRERRPFPAADVLRALAVEALVVCIIARSFADSCELADEDRERLLTAASRFLAAVDAASLDGESERLYRAMLKSRGAGMKFEPAEECAIG